MNNKYLLVVERSESQLSIQKEDDKYVLEGTFTEIGVKNNNNRIYDEKEILPHVNELKKACEGNKLLGELDHPKSFDISLKNASHVIEDISYDKESRTVKGRIRLLNTDAGKNAKALVDAGIPLHISSRAAGVVESNGHVKIKKMFTYDLVANPGFTNAELKRVNESYGFGNDENLGLFEVPWTIAESVEEAAVENLAEINKETETQNEIIKENQTMDSKKYISVEDFNEYTKLVKNEFTKLEKSITESTEKDTKSSSVNEGLIKYAEEIAKKVNDLSAQVTSLNENVEGLISHNDYIVENLEKVKDYAELIGEKTNQGINYSEKLAESVDHTIEYMRMVAEKTDQVISYTDWLAEESSNRWGYQTHINEHLDKVISHNDYIVEGVDSVTKYTEYIKENLQNLHNYVGMVVETINENVNESKEIPTEAVVESTEEKVETSITENVNFDGKSKDDFEKGINESLVAIMDAAKAEKEEAKSNKYHFLNFLSESKRNQFAVLPEDEQQKIVDAFSKNRWYGSNEAEKIWESCFITKKETKMDWLLQMPAKYVASWNGLNESQKNAIKGQASVRVLDTQYKIDDFWATRDLGKVTLVSENTERPVNESSEYKTSDSYMDAVKAGFRTRFKR
jgi:hypothetical protein